MSQIVPGVNRARSIIGVLHLRPLPGAPQYDHDSGAILRAALEDAEALIMGGVDAILIENFGDTPFFPDRVPSETVAWMTRIGTVIRARFTAIPLGICVLRNDGCSALAIAHSIDAQFIRVCILASPRVTDQGVIQGIAYRLLRRRARLRSSISILADVDIKHSSPLSCAYSLEADAADLVSRSHADAVIVTGSSTGVPIADSDLFRVRQAVKAPVLVGSGVTQANIAELLEHADGVIVGTAFKNSAPGDSRIDVRRVSSIIRCAR